MTVFLGDLLLTSLFVCFVSVSSIDKNKPAVSEKSHCTRFDPNGFRFAGSASWRWGAE